MAKLINWISRFFEEDNGKPSMIRFAMFISILVVCYAVVIISYKVFNTAPIVYYPSKEVQSIHPADYEYIFAMAFLIFGLLGAVGYAKVNQKSKESDISKP